MDPTSLSGREVAIHVGTDMEESSSDDIAGHGARRTCRNPSKIWNGFANANESINGDNTCQNRGFPGSFGVYIAKELVMDKTFMDEESTRILDRKNSAEKPKKKIFNKPPKPPRPPRALSLASSEEKLVREISELAKLKRARMERMKALKKMKNVNTSSSGSTSNLWALIVTLLFCFVIFWQAS